MNQLVLYREKEFRNQDSTTSVGPETRGLFAAHDPVGGEFCTLKIATQHMSGGRPVDPEL
jgi:hypothetical protein